MKLNTKSYLKKIYAKENKDLSYIIDKDVGKYWPYMENRNND